MAGAEQRRMRLGVMINQYGQHRAAWRLAAGMGQTLSYYAGMAKTAERGLLDLVFIADSMGLPRATSPASEGRAPILSGLEPLTLLSALAGLTEKVGLVGTVTTTYTHPYLVARQLSSLDHISGGRAGWNLVTSANPDEALAFGADRHAPPAERYRRAHEYAEVVGKLWDSWADDAFIFNQKAGRYFDPSKMRPLDHQGEFFRVNGLLNQPRSPQGRPVITQAGQSDDGIALAGATADVVFAMQPTLSGAQRFYAAIKGQAVANGRDLGQVVILPGLSPFVGATMAEAEAKARRLDEAVDFEVALEALTIVFGVDMTAYPLDERLPTDIPPSEMAQSRRQMIIDMGERDGLTLRQILAKEASSYGHWSIVGTPASIVDQMEERFHAKAADGFVIVPGLAPQGLDDFVTFVVPELQRRGLFRTVYEGQTLRDRLGLTRPAV